MNLSMLQVKVGIWLSVAAIIAGFAAFRFGTATSVSTSTSDATTNQPAAPVDPYFEAKPRPTSAFELVEMSGRKFSSDELRGKVWVANFFFAKCPGPCLRLNRQMMLLNQRFASAPDARFVSITVTPDLDTPENLRDYSRIFEPNSERWFFLTGETDAVHELIRKNFQMPVGGNSADPSTVLHSERLILIDRQGNIRGMYRGLEDVDLGRLQRKMTQLLEESE